MLRGPEEQPLRLTAALAYGVLASFAAAPRALATPSFTHLHEPCDEGECVTASARHLSPDGTLITGTLGGTSGLEWFRNGVQWEDVGGTWTQGSSVGAAGSNTPISSFVHVGLSETNVLLYELYWLDGYVETWIAPGATEPASRLPGAGCAFYDALIAARISADGSTVIGTLDCVFDDFVDGAYRRTEPRPPQADPRRSCGTRRTASPISAISRAATGQRVE